MGRSSDTGLLSCH